MNNILFLLSGGIDSTSALYQILKSNTYRVSVHHICLSHRHNRSREERLAVNHIVDWLQINIGEFDFTHSNFTFPMDLEMFPTDIAPVSTIAGYLSVSYLIDRDIKFDYIVTGYQESDFNNRGGTFRAKVMRDIIDSTWRYAIGQVTHSYEDSVRKASILNQLNWPSRTDWYPNKNKNKKQLIEELPPDLVELCWSCRRPIEYLTPCGKCKTCKELKDIGYFEKVGRSLTRPS